MRGPLAATRDTWREGTRKNDRQLGSAELSGLPDAERDASEVAELLAGIAALLRSRGLPLDDDARAMLTMAVDGSASAARVLDYLHHLRGSGDGASAAVPPRLGQWRQWVPSRGNLVGEIAATPRQEGLPRRHRPDPGE